MVLMPLVPLKVTVEVPDIKVPAEESQLPATFILPPLAFKVPPLRVILLPTDSN